MQLRFEHFASASLMGTRASPPRRNGSLEFREPWQARAFAIAIALSKQGRYEWEEFRRELIAAIAEWEAVHARDDPGWDYYRCWLKALESVASHANILGEDEIERRATVFIRDEADDDSR